MSDEDGEIRSFGYRRRCPKGVHASAGCPIAVDEGFVLTLGIVQAALLHYASTVERDPDVTWHDVTTEYRDEAVSGDEITEIRPR